MFKKLLLVAAMLVASVGFAFAQVDVNKADQAALDGIKGLGPTKSKMILAERSKAGSFKDWADFEARVKGIAEKSATKLSEAGLTVNGQARPAVAKAAASANKDASKPASKPESKPESKPASKPAGKATAASSAASVASNKASMTK